MAVVTVFPVVAVVRWVPAVSSEFAEMTSMILAVMSGSVGAQNVAELPVPTAVELSGFLALSILMEAVSGLVLGRWWQSLLYNPGGFWR